MKRSKEDNTVSVIQRAVRYFHIPVTQSSVKEVLKSNSHYPTFKSICDSFKEWNVDHYPLKYLPDEIRQLEAPYIVHFKNGGGQIAFVSEIKDNHVEYYESYSQKKETLYTEFIERCSGAVILLNPDESSGEKDFRSKWQNEIFGKALLPVAISVIILYIILAIINAAQSISSFTGYSEYFLLLTKTTGIAFSVLMVLHEFEIRNTLTDKLCHMNESTNCNTVLNDKLAKFFGWFGWADTGVIYFTGGLLFLLQGLTISHYSILAIVSALSLPYPVFSVYYQGFVLKKWCPLCLGVQVLLITEFILLLPQFSNLNLSFLAISGFILTLLVIGIVYTLLIMYFREKTSNEINYYKYLGFKKNPDVLRSLLSNQKPYEIPVNNTSLLFGAKDSPMKITAFLSLNCSHCARAFEKIKEILQSEANVTVNIVLVTTDSKILNALYQFNIQNKPNEALELLEIWYTTDPYSRSSLSENLCILEDSDFMKEVSNENFRLFKECNVLGTPTFFINGYQLPVQYDLGDINYFSEIFEIKEKINA